MKLKGWGGYPELDVNVSNPNLITQIQEQIKQKNNLIARGNGRSYGDSSISKANTISMLNFDKILSFDKETGELVAESGVLLKNIIEKYLSAGWFPYVSPGSKLVTVGGMVAADVHGKNHHKDGSFGRYVNWIDLICLDGNIKRCSRDENSDLFNWTIGGMGLTGVIIKISMNLRKVETSWIKKKTLIADNLNDAIEIFEKNMECTYTVAWIDSLKEGSSKGRSLIFLGEHAKIEDLKQTNLEPFPKAKNKIRKIIPFYFPKWILSKMVVKIFNTLFFFINKIKKKETLVSYENFFYPLDSIVGWNKIYGKKGFVQFQCVIPINNSRIGLEEILECLYKSGSGSFLSVLKRFGKDQTNISFPMEGYTLALDFPLNNKNLNLLDELDRITVKYGGRFYLAKDSRISSEIFNKSDNRINNFISFRKKNKFLQKFNSSQSIRLKI